MEFRTINPKDILIREANANDDLVIGELLVSSFVSAYKTKKPDFTVPADRQAHLRNIAEKRLNGTVLVSEFNREILGTVTLFKHDTKEAQVWDPQYTELRYLAVKPELHGSNLGIPLLEHSVRLCKEWGSKGISIRVRRGLDHLAKYYERFGFCRDERGDQDVAPGLYLEGYTMMFSEDR